LPYSAAINAPKEVSSVAAKAKKGAAKKAVPKKKAAKKK
jgi:hypothetical protein